MLLLDQGLPRTTAVFLRRSGIESIHVGEMGLAEQLAELLVKVLDQSKDDLDHGARHGDRDRCAGSLPAVGPLATVPYSL